MVTTPDGKIRHYISFGGVSTADYKCICNGSESFGAPERDVEKVSIPGRNGDLTFDNGRFKDVTIKYAMFFEDILEFEDFKNKVLALRGAQKLYDSHHPDEYRMASISGAMEPSVGGYLNAYCSLELNLTMYPQRYLQSGETAIAMASGAMITNPTQFDAKPLVMVYGTGNVNIGGKSIYVETNYNPTYIDCEIQSAYYISGGEHKDANSTITLSSGDFWTIPPGTSTVTHSATRIEIIPRWWCV